MSRSVTITVFTVVAFLALMPTADAHFKLTAPASRSVQDGLGGPQKSAPCGLSDVSNTADDSVPTNMVTTVPTGSKITISISEAITHPGHYRVSLAADIASLPADPPVAVGSTACGSTPINTSPTPPLLADGLFLHTQAFSGPQTAQVQLPAGFTCTNCVLQVTQFMSQHGINNPGGCYYHHCAILTISDSAPDAGVTPPLDDAGNTTPPGDDPATGGCCSTQRDGAAGSVLAAMTLGSLLLRRRRRR